MSIILSPTLLLLGLPWLTRTGDFLSKGWQQLSWWMFVHWALGKDRLDMEVVDRAVSNCQCLLLCFKRLLSEESEREGFRHFEAWIKAFIIQCWIKLNSTISTNSHSPLETIRIKAPAGNEPELANAQKGKRTRIIIINNKEYYKVPLLKSGKYTMQLQYVHNEEGLMPQDGANMLRVLQFLELAHLWVRPHTPGSKARPWVPEKFLLLYTCSTKMLWQLPWVSCPFWWEHPLYRVWLSASK